MTCLMFIMEVHLTTEYLWLKYSSVLLVPLFIETKAVVIMLSRTDQPLILNDLDSCSVFLCQNADIWML